MNAHEIDTALGPMRLEANRRGICGIWFRGQRHEPVPPQSTSGPSVLLDDLAAWLQDYCSGQIRTARFPLDLRGTAFQCAVWQALAAIPAASTVRYGELASKLGQPRAVRAVAAAVGRNPLTLLLPCHRVVGADGALTGYAGGLGRKRALLDLEAGRGLPWQQTTQAHIAEVGEVPRLEIGQRMWPIAHPNSAAWPGWLHGRDEQGRIGWFPEPWLRPVNGAWQAKRYYDARELDLPAGSAVLEIETWAGWSLVREAGGRIGWVAGGCLR